MKTFVTLIMLLGIFGGGYFYITRPNYSSDRLMNSDTVSELNTSNWKKKTDNSIGATFKHPEDLVAINMTEFNALSTSVLDSYQRNGFILYSKSETTEFNSYEAFHNRDAYKFIKVKGERELSVDDNKTVAVLFKGKSGGDIEYYRFNIFKDGYTYAISIAVEGKLSDYHIRTMNNIMDTFTFLR